MKLKTVYSNQEKTFRRREFQKRLGSWSKTLRCFDSNAEAFYFQYKFLWYLEYYYDICRPIEMGQMKMKNRIILSLFVLACLMAGCGMNGNVRVPDHPIVILFENDVHGAVDGYAKLVSLREKQREWTP